MQRGIFAMRHLGFAVIAAMCLGLAGCYPEPFQNPGDWAPTGAAKEDLAMQAADKDDLLAGRSEPGGQGVAAAAGVDAAIGGAAGTAAGLQKAPAAISFTSGTGD
jgi:hypothetical protein